MASTDSTISREMIVSLANTQRRPSSSRRMPIPIPIVEDGKPSKRTQFPDNSNQNCRVQRVFLHITTIVPCIGFKKNPIVFLRQEMTEALAL